MDRLAIGITFPADAPWRRVLLRNGIAQHALILARTLAEAGHRVRLLTAAGVPRENLPDEPGIECTTLDDVVGGGEPLQLILEAASNIDPAVRAMLHAKHGTVHVALILGAVLPIDMEEIFVREQPRLSGLSHSPTGLDAVLLSPHLAYQRNFVASLYDACVEILPYVWRPDIGVVDPAHRYRPQDFEAPAGTKPKIFCLEPNLNLVKNALVPIVAVNHLCRDGGAEMFDSFYVANADRWANNPFWRANYVRNLAFIQGHANKAQFGPRSEVDGLFAPGRACPGVVISHSWQCDLNYLHFELLWKGVPLVHSSTTLRDGGVGYFYEACDPAQAARQLRTALEEFRAGYDERAARSSAFLGAYDARSVATAAAVVDVIMQTWSTCRTPGTGRSA